MPVYNAEKYIYQAVKSILNQTYHDIELILIDDCGVDGSIELIRKEIKDSRLKCYRNDKNRGIAYSRNRGIDEARGEYIAFMDDDDLAPINRLKSEVEFLETNPEIDAVGGRYCVIDEEGKTIGYSDDTLQNPNYIKACLMFFDPLGNGSMLFRKRIVEENGIRFMDDCLGMEDYRFWVDFSRYGQITNLKEIMLYWRNVEGNETSRMYAQNKRKRSEKFAEIQRHAIKENGFDLPESEMFFLTSMLPEGRLNKKASRSELERLYRIFKTIVIQAKDMDNYNEVLIACRKQFSRRLECSEVWNI